MYPFMTSTAQYMIGRVWWRLRPCAVIIIIVAPATAIDRLPASTPTMNLVFERRRRHDLEAVSSDRDLLLPPTHLLASKVC